MLPLPLKPQTVAPAQITLPSEALSFVNHLRFVAMECRAKPRTRLFEACALVQTGPVASREAHAEALMRCLPEALGKPGHLYTPGTAVLTFDEKWLVQLGAACNRSDTDSQQFLLASRVAAENRRLVRYLAGAVAADFELT